jgi:hypothetical protein
VPNANIHHCATSEAKKNPEDRSGLTGRALGEPAHGMGEPAHGMGGVVYFFLIRLSMMFFGTSA